MKGNLRGVPNKDRTRIAWELRIRYHGNSEHGIIGYWPQMSETEADLERQNILADIRRGTWVPFSVQRKRAKQKQVVTAVTVREAATMFYNDIKGGLTPRGREGMLWRIGHLLEFFAKPDDPDDDPRNERVDWALQDVDHAAVSAYRRQKRSETRLKKGKTVPRLTPVNVNKTVEALARIIEWANMEGLYEGENPAASKAQREKVKRRDPVGTWLDYDLLMCALDAAADLDANSPRRDYRNLGRTLVLALLFIGGLRVTEVCLLRWRHVDFARGVIRIIDSKGRPLREVVIVAGLRDFLLEYKARTRWPGRDDHIVPTAKGKRRTKDSVRQRILNPTIARAAELADERELPQAFPETLGTHAGKRTAASYLIEAGYDIGWVMDQLGHADGRLTMAVYRQSRRRRKDPRVRELVWSPELEAMSLAHPSAAWTSRRPRRAATAPAPRPPSSRRAAPPAGPTTPPTTAAPARVRGRPRGAAGPHVIAGYDAAWVARQCGTRRERFLAAASQAHGHPVARRLDKPLSGVHRSGRRSLLTPPRPATHADPGPSAAPDHRRWSSPDVFDPRFGRAGEPTRPHRPQHRGPLSRRRSERQFRRTALGARTASRAPPSCSSPSRSATPATRRRGSPRRSARSPVSSARPACARRQRGQRGHGIDFGDGRKNPQHRPQTRGYGTA